MGIPDIQGSLGTLATADSLVPPATRAPQDTVDSLVLPGTAVGQDIQVAEFLVIQEVE